MLDIRYVAGLFDGEGCISLVKQKRLNSDLPTYTIRVVLAMCHKPIIKRLHQEFGGLYSERLGTEKARNSFSIMWANNKAIPFLEQLAPHLVLKKAEAEVALEFLSELSSVGTSFWRKATTEQIADLQSKREDVRSRLAHMKRVNYSLGWDGSEFGENPMPGLEKDAEGQPRAKQELTTLGVCND